METQTKKLLMFKYILVKTVWVRLLSSITVMFVSKQKSLVRNTIDSRDQASEKRFCIRIFFQTPPPESLKSNRISCHPQYQSLVVYCL